MSEKKEGEPQVITAEQIEDLKAQIATLTTEKENVVGELKEDRTKRQELQEQVETLQKALEDAVKANAAKQDPNDIATTVQQLLDQKLSERDASIAKGNKVAAIERFVSEHKEFHPENDTTGKRREALENAMKRFNTAGLISEADFYAVVKDAARLLGTDTVPTDPSEKPDIPSGPTSSGEPKTVDVSGFTEQEKKLMEKNGMSPERFKALKEKNPNYIQDLLQFVN